MATFMASLHQRATTPITPAHSPHPSLHSKSSLSCHPKALSIHEYRKQLSLPCTPDLVGSKRVKRKAAASSLKTVAHTPRVTFAEFNQHSFDGKGPPVREPLDAEAQLHLGPPSPESPVLDSFCIKHASDAQYTSIQDASNLLERPLSFAKKLASRKRLPRRDNINLARAPPRDSIYSDPSSIDRLSSAGLSESSTFTLSKYPFPLPPSGVESVRLSSINVLPASPHPQQDISLILPDTPPATPATLHYRGASFDLVNPRQSLFHSNFEPPEDPDLETGNELFDRYPLKSLLPGDMADSEGSRKEAANKPEHQGRKIFDSIESAYASIAQQKAHGMRDQCIQSPERRMTSVEALTSPPVDGKKFAIQTPRSVSDKHPPSTLYSPNKTPRGPSFMDRIKGKIRSSPVMTTHNTEQELEELNEDGTPTKNRHLVSASEELLLPHDAIQDEDEVKDRSSLNNSAWESISEQPTEPRYSMSPSSVYPESRRISRPYSLAASSIYQDSGIPPNSAFFGPVSNRGSIPWGVMNRATDYSTEMSMAGDMWKYKSDRNSYQKDHGHSRGPSNVNDTTLGSIIDHYGNEVKIGKRTGSSIATSFDDRRQDSFVADQSEEETVRLNHVPTGLPRFHLDPGTSEPEQLGEPSKSPAFRNARLPKLQTNVAESRIGSPPLQSPPPLGPLPKQPFFARGSTELLSGQGSYGDTNRLLNAFSPSGSSASDLSVSKRRSFQDGDRLAESPLQSIIDQCSAQSSPMERHDPFYLENAIKQCRASLESCSTQSSGGGILGEQGIDFKNHPMSPKVQVEHEDQGTATGDVADEIPAIWTRKVSPNAKSSRYLHVNTRADDVPASWTRKVSPNAESQRLFPGYVGPTAASADLRSDTDTEWDTDEGASGFETNSALYQDSNSNPYASPSQGKGKQAVRHKLSFEQLSLTESVATDLIPKRSDTNPWRNKKKGADGDSPVKTPGKDMPRFPRESQLIVDSYEGDLSRAFPSEHDVRAANGGLQHAPSSPSMCPKLLGRPGYGTPEYGRQLSSPNAPLLPQGNFSPPLSSPLSPAHRSDQSAVARAPITPGHRHHELFYSPTADGIDAAHSAPSTMAAVFPTAARDFARTHASETPSRCSVLTFPSVAMSTGDHRLDEMREMRRLKPCASVHYDETLSQRRMEKRRRISERLDAKTLVKQPTTSLQGGTIDPLHPRAAVRSQRSVLPLRLGSDSVLPSTTSFGTQIRHRRASDVETARRPWCDHSPFTPTTVGEPARYRSPRLMDVSRSVTPDFEEVGQRQARVSWKMFWAFGLFAPFGLLIYTGHFDVFMPYLTENEVETIGKKQKNAALAVAIGECAVLLFVFWLLKMLDVV